MPRIIEAVIERDGHVRLLEPVTLPESRRGLVTVLDGVFDDGEANSTAAE